MRHEPPNGDEIDSIARHIIHGQEIVERVTGQATDASLSDLDLIQVVINSNSIASHETYSLQSLGMLLGKIIISNNEGFDWWMIDDEYGRDPTVRYLQTSLSLNVQTMISKRIEDGESVSVDELYSGVLSHARQAIDDGIR